ncbi:MAG: [NiFe]-hydrogenase assembly chaperone HybE [Sulfuritalea sp.]|nr:[NiFe]-hydrogenase assembly chaperone HybE [Sulfuritalea sp.]
MAFDDPVAGLLAAFERIAATRMAGLAMNNPALRVAAVGFRPWQEATLVGVLITPWAINLIVLGSRRSDSLRLTADRRQTWEFPSGRYDFMGGDEAESGAYQFCSLFSPVDEFTGQAIAEATAADIMDALFVDASVEAKDRREMARLAGRSTLHAETSRRVFLRGVFSGLKG